MLSYRAYFRYREKIIGRDDFEAPDGSIALAITEGVYDALTDRCNGFELWEGDRRVAPRSLADEIRLEYAAVAQEIMIAREEAIQDGNWRLLGSSARLSEKLNGLRTLKADGDHETKADSDLEAPPHDGLDE